MSEVVTNEPETLGKKITARRYRQLEDEKKIKALELAAMNTPTKEIVEITGLSNDTVLRLRHKFSGVFKRLEKIEEFRDVRSDIFAAGQLQALESAFSGNKLEKASFTGTIEAVERLHKMERLERNQSTNNIAIKMGEIGLKD